MNHELSAIWARWSEFSPETGEAVRVFFAPGRVNLIGEHLDYNGGIVFPAALALGTWAIVRRRPDSLLRFASTAMAKEVTVNGTSLSFHPEQDFANYPIGVIWALRREGLEVPGLDVLFHGNLPQGAGLSSSASMEMAMAVAIVEIVKSDLARVRLAEVCQLVENEFIGVHSGIMDQFAVAMGKKHHGILLNCDTLEHDWVPLALNGYQLVMTNSNQRRELATSEYNQRRAECDEALADLQRKHPGITHLAHVTPEQWELWSDEVTNPASRRRARHVVTENTRVLLAAQALKQGRLEEFGQLLNQSHHSLRDDFEVTGPFLDTLAEAAWAAAGCIGSRMTGGGFGGCTVSIVRTDAIERFKHEVAVTYEKKTGLSPSFYVTDSEDGAREVTEEVQMP